MSRLFSLFRPSVRSFVRLLDSVVELLPGTRTTHLLSPVRFLEFSSAAAAAAADRRTGGQSFVRSHPGLDRYATSKLQRRCRLRRRRRQRVAEKVSSASDRGGELAIIWPLAAHPTIRPSDRPTVRLAGSWINECGQYDVECQPVSQRQSKQGSPSSGWRRCSLNGKNGHTRAAATGLPTIRRPHGSRERRASAQAT